MSDINPDRSLAPNGDKPHPFFWDAALKRWLVPISERVTRLRANPLPPATVQSLRLWFRTQHVFHSNAIEGSTLTLYETQVVIGDGLTVGGKPLRDVLAARNLAHALDWVEGLGQSDEPLTERVVREIHELVMRGEDEALPGRYKTENNRVTGATFRTPSFLQTPSLMESLGRYLETLESDPVVSSAVAHAWMVGIHPFRDGNGRTARLLANLVLIRKGYPVALLTEDRRPDYYSALDHAHCTGDLTDFIGLWCACVGKTLEEYERLSGALEVREGEIAYLANLVNASSSTTAGRLEQWRGAIENLAGELRSAAEALNRKLSEGAVEVSALPLTASLLSQARNGAAPVIRLTGQLSGGPFMSEISLVRSEVASAPAGVALQLLWADPHSTQKKLVELRLDGPRLTLVWRHPMGNESEERGKTYTESATLILKEALERTAGLMKG